MSPTNVDANMIQLGYHLRRVLQYQGYDINRYTFYTKQQDDKSTVQNSGVTLIATMTDSSRMTIAKNSYYGVAEDIWELDFTLFVIPLLKCKWVNNTRGVKVDSDSFTCVNLSTHGYLSYPFILAKQATQDPPEPRTRRGINRIQDLPVGESVEFNQFGQAVGKWQYLYGKYIGTRTRRLISILKKNWKQVTKEEKNFLWSDIKAHFRLENDDVKKRTLVSCGTKWKAFKTKLRVKFMLKKVSPLQKWTFIEPNVWEEFCQNENTPAKNWQEERNDPDKAIEFHLIPDIHGSNNCLVRAPRDKNGIKTLPPELIDVSKNLVQATRELAQGSNESKAGVDPLILELGPEHGGRTRGLGCDIGYKKGIEGYVRKKRAYEQQKDIKEIRNEVRQQMKEELKSSDFWEEMRAELKAKLRNKMKAEQNLFSPRQEGNHISVQMRSNLSSTKSIGRKEQQGEHNESISTMQVDVPSSVQRRSNLSSTISIIREEHQGEHNESISTRQVDVPSSVHMRSNLSSTTSTVKLHCIKKVVCATATVYPIGDGILHFKKLLKGHMKVSVIKVVEIHKSKELPISDDEIPNLKFAMKGFIQWPIAAIARFTILYLLYLPLAVEKEKAANKKSLQALEDENKVGFLNPGMIRADSCFYEKWATIDYLTQSLMGYEFYLAPYLQGVVGSLKWEFPLANRQPGDWECGYYVMKWMHDFVLKYQNENFSNIKLPKKTIAAESNSSRIRFSMHYEVVLGCSVPWSNERPLENKEFNAIIGAWFTLWRD
ncbi:ulp1 protease family, C-terminal catalytic domain-containing protein [Tanacetum coccineum]